MARYLCFASEERGETWYLVTDRTRCNGVMIYSDVAGDDIGREHRGLCGPNTPDAYGSVRTEHDELPEHVAVAVAKRALLGRVSPA